MKANLLPYFINKQSILFLFAFMGNYCLMAQGSLDTLLLSSQHHLFLESIQTIGTTEITNNAVSFKPTRSGGMGLGYRYVPRITKRSALSFGISLSGVYIESSEYGLSEDYFKTNQYYWSENTAGNLLYKLSLDYVFRQPLSTTMLFEAHTGINMTGVAFMINIQGASFSTAQTDEPTVSRRSYTQQFKAPIGIQIGVGIAKMLGNKNFFRLGIGYYYAPHNIFAAKYSFASSDASVPVITGRYSQSASHVSITFAYVFSTNKQLFKK